MFAGGTTKLSRPLRCYSRLDLCSAHCVIKALRAESRRRRARPAQLCDAAAWPSDEEVFYRDEWGGRFALNNIACTCSIGDDPPKHVGSSHVAQRQQCNDAYKVHQTSPGRRWARGHTLWATNLGVHNRSFAQASSHRVRATSATAQRRFKAVHRASGPPPRKGTSGFRICGYSLH